MTRIEASLEAALRATPPADRWQDDATARTIVVELIRGIEVLTTKQPFPDLDSRVVEDFIVHTLRHYPPQESSHG